MLGHSLQQPLGLGCAVQQKEIEFSKKASSVPLNLDELGTAGRPCRTTVLMAPMFAPKTRLPVLTGTCLCSAWENHCSHLVQHKAA
jgi:hypothetical protein